MKLEELAPWVAEMRRLGVSQVNGIVLGAEPPKPTAAERAAAVAASGVEMTAEIREELVRYALVEWRQQTRDLLPNGDDFTDEQLDAMRPPPDGLGAAP